MFRAELVPQNVMYNNAPLARNPNSKCVFCEWLQN